MVEIQTKKKTVAATRAICGPSPRPNMLRKTGSRASFGTTYRASSNGSSAARTSESDPISRPSAYPAAVPIA